MYVEKLHVQIANTDIHQSFKQRINIFNVHRLKNSFIFHIQETTRFIEIFQFVFFFYTFEASLINNSLNFE